MNVIAEFIRTQPPYERLRVTENKLGLRGSLINERGRVFSTAMFYERDRDNTVFRVTEYFGFNNENSYQIISTGRY